MSKFSIVYAGLDINTFFLLTRESEFELVGVAYNEDLAAASLNPVNLIGSLLYLQRKTESSAIYERIVRFLWRVSSFASTGVLRRYRHYITRLSVEQIKIIDLDDPSSTVFLKDNTDLLLVNAWGLLEGEIVRAPKYGTFNVHPSQLPRYRGAVPTLWALKNKDIQSAVTYMLIDESMDGGPIISQHIFNLERDENWLSIESKVADVVRNTLVSDIKKYLQGNVAPHPQDEEHGSVTATYNGYRRINWEAEKGVDIYNKINLYPHLEYGFYCFFVEGKRKVYIKKAQFKSLKGFRNPLKIHFKTTDGYLICSPFIDLSMRDSLKYLFN